MKLLGSFKDVSDVARDFQIEPSVLEGVDILLAAYDLFSYEGSAVVIFRKDGELNIVSGSHCSCSGLEGQWEPVATDWATLSTFTFYGEDGSIQQAINELVAANTGGVQ